MTWSIFHILLLTDKFNETVRLFGLVCFYKCTFTFYLHINTIFISE